MPIFTTFGGAAARAYGFGMNLAPALLPANTILFWSTTNTTTPPSGWSNHTDGNGKFVRGSFTIDTLGSIVAANAAAAASITVTTSTIGDHFGSPSISMFGNSSAMSPSSSPFWYVHYNGPAGAHTHSTMSVNVSGVVPDSINLPMVRLSSNTTTIPANTVIFRKTVPSSGNYIAYDTQMPAGRNHGFYRGGTSRSYANSSGYGVGNLNTAGAHNHQYAAGKYGPPGPASLGAGWDYAPIYVNGGSHTHTAQVPLKSVLRSMHLNAWISPVAESVEYGMIVMFTGDLNKLPSGWRRCDGTLGTPDMTDYFLGYIPAGTHGVAINETPWVGTDPDSSRSGTTTTSANPHTHLSSPSGGIPGYPGYLYGGYHGTYADAHNHTVSVTSSAATAVGMMPDHITVAFIQYKGI